MAEGNASTVPESEVMGTLKSLQEQLQEQQRVQASILQQFGAVQQSSISASSHTPVASGLPPPVTLEGGSGEFKM